MPVFLVIGCFNQMTTYFQLAVWFTASVIEKKKLNLIAINFSSSGSYKPINRLFFNPALFLQSRGKLRLPIFYRNRFFQTSSRLFYREFYRNKKLSLSATSLNQATVGFVRGNLCLKTLSLRVLFFPITKFPRTAALKICV